MSLPFLGRRGLVIGSPDHHLSRPHLELILDTTQGILGLVLSWLKENPVRPSTRLGALLGAQTKELRRGDNKTVLESTEAGTTGQEGEGGADATGYSQACGCSSGRPSESQSKGES